MVASFPILFVVAVSTNRSSRLLFVLFCLASRFSVTDVQESLLAPLDREREEILQALDEEPFEELLYERYLLIFFLNA